MADDQARHKVKTVSVVMVAILLVTLMTPRPADAINVEVAVFLAVLGVALALQVVY